MQIFRSACIPMTKYKSPLSKSDFYFEVPLASKVLAWGRSRGGGGDPWGLATPPPPPPSRGTPKLHKEGKKTLCVCVICHVLVLNSYPDTPLSEILYPPLLVMCLAEHAAIIFDRTPLSSIGRRNRFVF